MNSKLEQVIRVLKHRNLLDATTNSELAELSSLSSKTIVRNEQEITNYIQIAPRPSKVDTDAVDKKLIDNYINIACTATKKDKYLYMNILGAVAGFVLRQQYNLINDVKKQMKVINIGLAFIDLARQIKSRKDSSSGVPIHSKSKSAIYLLHECNKVSFIDKLFTRSDNYQSGMYSKSWKLSKMADGVLDDTINQTLNFIASGNVQSILTHLGSNIFSNRSGITNQTFTITVEQLSSLSLLSILHILSCSNPSSIDTNSIEVSLENLSSTDASIGRDYNVFTRLRSDERKSLGYINYDISGGIQIIAFSILYKYGNDPDLFEKYPMLFQYGFEPNYKKALREEISSTLNVSINEVKALLTAYANGSSKDSGKNIKLKQFAEESDLLRKEVISAIAQSKPHILELAQKQSKRNFPSDLNWMAVEEEDSKVARDKASIFFFIWTYFEKQIRDAMLSLVSDGIPVHDAIYSKQQLPCTDFEEAVLKTTGFELKISN